MVEPVASDVDADIVDREHMSWALRLAARGSFTTSPNPRVGCVLVRDGRVLGEGWHRQAGSAHAEVDAIGNADQSLRGATAYVSLEPCSHQGLTPPCVDTLIAAGLSRVVVAMEDPNPRERGRGIAALRAAGIEVSCGILGAEARALNRGFVARMRHGLPFVFAKLASSLDGRTAMANGESKWITGVAARQQVQRLRAASCAIMTGVGTVLQDDPSLTVRPDLLAVDYPLDDIRQPLRVILDSTLRTPLNAKILSQPGQSIIVTGVEDAARIARYADQGHSVATLPLHQGRMRLKAVLAWLAEEKFCNQVMVESGATLAGALLIDGLLDELHLFIAPTLLGSSARPLMELPLTHIGAQQRLVIEDIRAVGDDWWLRARPR